MIIRSKRKGKYPDYEGRRRLKNRIIAIAIVIFFILGFNRDHANINEYTEIESVKYSYHFPDLGQGDCTIIKSESKCIVVDTGPYEERFMCGHYVDKLTDVVDLLVFTHPHSDHIGGFEELLARVEVRCVMIPDVTDTNSQYERYLSLIRDAGIDLIRVKPGYIYPVGDIELYVLAPFRDDTDDDNENSIVIKAKTDEVSLLVTGDIGHKVEKELIDTYGDLMKCDILKVPHHGSANSSSAEFLEAVSPEYAVVCCSDTNVYGHPAWQTQKRLKEAGIPYYPTYKYGTIVLVSDGKNVELCQ